MGGDHIGARGPPSPGRLGDPEDGGLGLEQGRDQAPSPRGRHTAHTRPDVYSTVDDLAAIRPEATGPHPRTIRGLLGGACAGWRVRPTSVELHRALRADNPTNRQRSMATVLINEASFEDLLNAHTEGAFTWRQFARAAQRQAAVPPPRIRQINDFATPQLYSPPHPGFLALTETDGT